MDETLTISCPEDEAAATPAAAWPQAVMWPSAKLLDSEMWFSEARLHAGALEGDLP